MVQIILLLSLAWLAISLVRSRGTSRTKAYKKVLLLLFVIAAIFLVLFPNASTTLAHHIGVGRGADLISYAAVIVLLFTLFNNYVKDQQQQRRQSTIVRRLAILEAKQEGRQRPV